MTEKKLKWYRIHFEAGGHRGDCSLPAEDLRDAVNKFRQDHPWFYRAKITIREIHE